MNPDLIRGATRPIVTVLITITLCALAIADTLGYDVPQWFIAFGIPVVVWWFGERLRGHVKEKKGD